jgi:hypothetical protein
MTRSTADQSLKRRREEQAEQLSSCPMNFLDRIIQLRGTGGTEKQKRLDAFLECNEDMS